MTIIVSDAVYRRLEEVKEWLESRSEREAPFDELLIALLDHFEIVEHPEDVGSGKRMGGHICVDVTDRPDYTRAHTQTGTAEICHTAADPARGRTIASPGPKES